MVPSAETEDRYEVTLARGVWSCSCPARVRCWHISLCVVLVDVGIAKDPGDNGWWDYTLNRPRADLLRWIRATNRRERAAEKEAL